MQALERLRALGVVDLGHENWRSTIRHLVQGVRGYDAPEPYEHAEVADIMYEDHHGIMTRLLRRKAFASFATWQESVDEDEVSSTTAFTKLVSLIVMNGEARGVLSRGQDDHTRLQRTLSHY